MTNAISMVDLRQGYVSYRDEIDAAIKRVLESGWYVLGPELENFEKDFARWCGARHCIGVGNGTNAITIALRGLELGSGDAVFTVSHTAVATVAGIERAGAKPVLIDIDPKTYTIDPAKLEEAIVAFGRSGSAGRPRAVIAVHLYGHPCDMAALRTICDRYDLKLIEDCAQAHGATVGGKRIGSLADAAAFSFYPTKNLGAFGDGGAVVTSDEQLAKRCAALRQYGWFERYYSDISGDNSRLDELHAAILSVRLLHLDEEISARQSIAGRYNQGLAAQVEVPVVRDGYTHAYHLYVIRAAARDALSAFLNKQDIASALHYPAAVHRQKAYEGRIHVGPGGLSVTDQAYEEILSLPMHPFLTDADVQRVIEQDRQWKGAAG